MPLICVSVFQSTLHAADKLVKRVSNMFEYMCSMKVSFLKKCHSKDVNKAKPDRFHIQLYTLVTDFTLSQSPVPTALMSTPRVLVQTALFLLLANSHTPLLPQFCIGAFTNRLTFWQIWDLSFTWLWQQMLGKFMWEENHCAQNLCLIAPTFWWNFPGSTSHMRWL